MNPNLKESLESVLFGQLTGRAKWDAFFGACSGAGNNIDLKATLGGLSVDAKASLKGLLGSAGAANADLVASCNGLSDDKKNAIRGQLMIGADVDFAGAVGGVCSGAGEWPSSSSFGG